MIEHVDLQEFLGAFIVEAGEIIAAANASLLDIEAADGAPRPRAVRDLFRALHTIKGLAGMMGVEPIVDIAHALETVVRDGDRAGGTLRRNTVEVALQGIRAIAERVRAVAENRPVAEAPERLLDAIATIEVAQPVVTTTAIPDQWNTRLSPSERQQVALALQCQAPVWTLTFAPSELNATRGITIATVRTGLAAIGEIVKVVPHIVPATTGGEAGVTFEILVISEASRAAIGAIAAADVEQVVPLLTSTPDTMETMEPLEPIELAEEVSTIGRAVVRVELSRLDDLQDQLSLLLVSRFRLDREINALADQGHDVRRLREAANLQGRLLRDHRRAILRARMVRVSEVLEPLTLLARNLARSNNRSVHLELDARDTELDKAVADRLLPALIHLVRNAVDHAIEAPDHREKIGKPRAATIRVSCVTAGNHIDILVSDDGRGIDRAAIARRANRPVDDDAALLDVLTSPGFSTRDVATTTSGRGFGMDIVRRIAVGDLGGELSMTTRLDVGTTFTLRVPVTIAVMEVFSFQCGPQAFVVPAIVVEEVIEIEPGMIVTPPNVNGSKTSALSLLQRRGRAIPLVSLGAVLSIDSGERARKALVIRRNGDPMAFTVDRVIGRQEVVIRTIDDALVNVPGIAGATDLGDGRPTLVLDLNELGIIAREQRLS